MKTSPDMKSTLVAREFNDDDDDDDGERDTTIKILYR